MIPDYYAVLGVPESATETEIRTAYRRLVRRYHPDVNKAAGAEDHIKEINLAYESLSDPVRRKHYDRASQVLRDEQARIAYEERMRSTSPPPPPAPQPTPAPSQPSRQHATIRARPAGMRSGKVVLATVLLVVLAMIVASQFDVPARGKDGLESNGRSPHLLPTMTPVVVKMSYILPDEEAEN